MHMCVRVHIHSSVLSGVTPLRPYPTSNGCQVRKAKFSQNWRASPAYVLSTRKDVYAQIRTCVNLRVTPSMPWACARFSEVS